MAYTFTVRDSERLSPQDWRESLEPEGSKDWRESRGSQDSLALELRVLMGGPENELLVKLDGQEIGRVNGCGQDWQTRRIISGGRLEAGSHELTVSTAAGSATIEWLDLR